MDEEPTGSCPTCSRRDPHEPLICRVCRSKLRTWLGDLPALFEELEERTKELAEPLDHRPYVATMVEMAEGSKKRVVRSWQVLTMRAADQVAYLLPAGATSSPSHTGPVSGSKEPRLPIDVDGVDLTAPARNAWLLGDDQVGHSSVASTLDFWARDWREARGGLERLPEPYVPALSSWLLRRVDDAMDAHPAIDEFFHDVRRTHGALRGQLGLVDVPDYKRGVACSKCGTLALYRENGSEWVECGVCGAMLNEGEYVAYVAALAAQVRQEKAA
jgi:hypothetical protein